MCSVSAIVLKVCLAYSLIVILRGECPQNTFDSITVRVCGSKCLSSVVVKGCIEPETVLEDARTVDIELITSNKVPVLRRGAIQNLPELYYISAMTCHISRIYAGAFLNLPKLDTIQLTFNDIEEILWGVFSNTSVSKIELDYNIVSSIENEAFSHMPNLKHLNLFRNQLTEYRKSWFTGSPNLEVLLLAYNKIEKIHSSAFDIFPNLRLLDLSFNRIKEIGVSAFENVKTLGRLDLSSNRLSWIKPGVFNTTIVVKELRLPLNRLSFLSTQFLEKGDVRAITLHPNPWQCPCLDTVLQWMGSHNVTLQDPRDDHRLKYNPGLPQCSINPSNRFNCVVGYDEAFRKAQEIFFKEVNYSDTIREKPTSERPNYDVLITDPNAAPNKDFSPIH